MGVTDILGTLRKRLPELEWQLSKPGLPFSPRSLPAGLFRTYDEDPLPYVAEIKVDINTLASHPNPRIVRYLAEKINQKINVLVSVCAVYNREKPIQEATGYVIDQLATRRQWSQALEADIERLEEQKQALLATLAERADYTLSLKLHSELGNLERKLTMAKEAYAKAR